MRIKTTFTSKHTISLTPRRRDILRYCNDFVYLLSGRYFLKQAVPSFEKWSARKLRVLVKPLKILMKEFNLVRLKNKPLHRNQARISEAYSQKFVAFFQFF